MSEILCPTCGATGDQNCSTVRGNGHRKRMLLEIAPEPPEPSHPLEIPGRANRYHGREER
uniref:Uncharacterized protein n=1 Tax=Microbacterium phage Judebell TaxID=3230835 RepID=A0AAU8EFG1_9CAUD